jgi:hypothetical protein
MHPTEPRRMSRAELMKQLADIATRPLVQDLHEAEVSPPEPVGAERDLFVWFEDTAARSVDGRRGVAGLPESLLPCARGMRVVERRYTEGHMHLLCAVHLTCRGDISERIAALYTAALSVGTVAWIGTGAQYKRTWSEMYGACALLPRPASS